MATLVDRLLFRPSAFVPVSGLDGISGKRNSAGREPLGLCARDAAVRSQRGDVLALDGQ